MLCAPVLFLVVHLAIYLIGLPSMEGGKEACLVMVVLGWIGMGIHLHVDDRWVVGCVDGFPDRFSILSEGQGAGGEPANVMGNG